MDPSTASAVSDSPAAPPPPPPPPTPSHHRRPRVREVSSRFMSPAVSSTVQRRRHQVDSLNSSTDENTRPSENSEGTPFPIGSSISQFKGNLGNSTNTLNSTTQRKQRAVKLFKENNSGSYDGVGRERDPSRSCSGRIGIGNCFGAATPGGGGGGGGSSRPDTPNVVVPSRYRLTPHHKGGSGSGSSSGNVSAAAKLLQASGMSMKGIGGCSGLGETNSVSGCDVSSVCSDDDYLSYLSDSGVSCSIQSLPELCSDADMLPTVSNRSVAEKIGNRFVLSSSSSSNCGSVNGDLKLHASSSSSPFYRSISLSSPGGDNLLVHSIKGGKKQTPSLPKLLYGNQSNHGKVGGGGGASLPPVPRCARPVAETRKGEKGCSPKDDMHCLRMMYNRYLQWRYANAKAVSVMKVQQRESEKALYSHAMKISEMRDSVKRKCVELELLRRSKALSTILEAQIPYLDEWSSLEEDYSISITEAVQALVNASVQVPVGGNVRVDVREVGEALNSASKMMETIVFNIQKLMPKAQETEVSISELARVASGERALIGECGDLLSKTYKSQVEECSLRGQIMQLHSTCHMNKITEQQANDNSIAICAANEPSLVSL